MIESYDKISVIRKKTEKKREAILNPCNYMYTYTTGSHEWNVCLSPCNFACLNSNNTNNWYTLIRCVVFLCYFRSGIFLRFKVFIYRTTILLFRYLYSARFLFLIQPSNLQFIKKNGQKIIFRSHIFIHIWVEDMHEHTGNTNHSTVLLKLSNL